MNVEWMVIRASGIVAFTMLALATIWGLLISTKLLGKVVKARPLTYFHESLGLGALIATIVHMVMLGLDDYIHFGPSQILVPGASSWRPFAVSLGVVAFYATTIVSLSFYVKRWIGHERWKTIHFIAFGTYLATLMHGVLAGTDTMHPVILGLYVTSAALVFGLVAVRALTPAQTPSRRAVRL